VAILLQLAEKQMDAGAREAAIRPLLQAQELDPENPFVREHIRAMEDQETSMAQSVPTPELGTGVIQLAPKAALQSFHLRAPAPEMLRQVYSAYGIQVMVDDSVPSTSVRMEMDHADFRAASTAVQLLTNTFVVPLNPRQVLAARDTRQNREKFEQYYFETFYLPGLSGKEMIDASNLVKNVFGVKQVAVRPENSTMSVRAPGAILRALDLTMAGLFQEKPEVDLDVRVYQVNYSRTMDFGPQLPQQFTVFNVTTELQGLITNNQSTIDQLISSGLVNPGDYAAIAALLVYYGLASGSILAQPFAMFGNGLTLSGLSFGPTTMNASLNISRAKQLDHVQLRAEEMQTSNFLFGSRYPITTASYSAGAPTPSSVPIIGGAAGLGGFAGLGTSTAVSEMNTLAMAPQVQYEDLGLTLKVTPQVRRDGQVDMQLEIKIESLAGASLNGVPVLNSRAFTTSVGVKDGDSALLVSSMTRQEENVLSGIPGLSELPGMSWTASVSKQVTVGDVVLVVTPHILHSRPEGTASRMYPVPPNMQ
jgi:type II secretory pathway component GspD/PulD (secretin)